MNADYLKQFEEMNETTENVFDLGETGILIILKDGTNLTSWEDVDDYSDVLYLSEDFSQQKTYSRCHYCNNAEVIIIKNCIQANQLGRTSLRYAFSHMEALKAFYAIGWDTSYEKDMENVFEGCYSLEYIYLENWDTSNVGNFWGMFINCCNLKTLDGLENWDLSSAVNMESMFESCISLEDISALSNWDMSNSENIFEMFRDCYSLKDASCLDWKFDNLKNGDNLFIHCHGLKKYPKWYDEEYINRFGIRRELENMDDKTIMDKILNDEFESQDLFVAISYIENERFLKQLINDDSLHFYVRRAVLLNPNYRDIKSLEDYALNSYGLIERCYAIENPNFKNIELLKRIAKHDDEYIVRFKAERKLKQLLYNRLGKTVDN